MISEIKLGDIDLRTQEILKAIIISYINKLAPVSSRKLAKELDINLSPATIRNIMADLEELGFLIQPHTSAGRVPTDQAYRFFVELLFCGLSELSIVEQEIIRNQFGNEIASEEEILQDIPKIINRISSYVGLSVSPNFRKLILKHIHFISLGPTKVLSVIVTQPGSVYQKVILIDEDIAQDELDKVSNFINSSFQNLSLERIRDKIAELMVQERILYDNLLQKACFFSEKAFENVGSEDTVNKIYLEGTQNIFTFPELANIDSMKKIFEAFLEKKRLIILLNQLMKDDKVSVCIGSESKCQNLEDLSLIISPYKKGNQTVGGLGVIGPTRMPYERMIALIDYLSKLVSTLLTSREVNSFE